MRVYWLKQESREETEHSATNRKKQMEKSEMNRIAKEKVRSNQLSVESFVRHHGPVKTEKDIESMSKTSKTSALKIYITWVKGKYKQEIQDMPEHFTVFSFKGKPFTLPQLKEHLCHLVSGLENKDITNIFPEKSVV